jgi:hypothetical protein
MASVGRVATQISWLSPYIQVLEYYINLYHYRFLQSWGRRGMRTGFWWESQKERGHKEDIVIGNRITLTRSSGKN